MDERDFEGTLVLEQLARIDKLDEFMDAIDSEDLKRVAALMRAARIDPATISLVLKNISNPDDDH